MAINGPPHGSRGSRMDAAMDQMEPYGFTRTQVRKRVNELLSIYGGQKYWTFIEDNGYKVLVDSLLDEQEESPVRSNVDDEKDTYSLEEGEIDPRTIGGENEDINEEDAQSQNQLEEVMNRSNNHGRGKRPRLHENINEEASLRFENDKRRGKLLLGNTMSSGSSSYNGKGERKRTLDESNNGEGEVRNTMDELNRSRGQGSWDHHLPPRGSRGSRMDAAMDQMEPYGFTRTQVRKRVNELLSIYGGQKYWTFIEDNGYKVLVDSLLDEQEESPVRSNVDDEKDTYSLEEGEIDPRTIGGENEDINEEDAQSQNQLEEVMNRSNNHGRGKRPRLHENINEEASLRFENDKRRGKLLLGNTMSSGSSSYNGKGERKRTLDESNNGEGEVRNTMDELNRSRGQGSWDHHLEGEKEKEKEKENGEEDENEEEEDEEKEENGEEEEAEEEEEDEEKENKAEKEKKTLIN
ncbi:high mobility group nucleosome-binding domain-containing protein 5-like [Impatiens glandulifera]|uniref:high mobility group nucleosome-binding domain-containing protein 5-like n=1 Tax=Impatiens glandulifera TaxID=253017 RepID=UPI001FB1613B|nr:high mobility group nucleosome-binding domain-containing protein 5-like [Impatiens glandulifera]